MSACLICLGPTPPDGGDSPYHVACLRPLFGVDVPPRIDLDLQHPPVVGERRAKALGNQRLVVAVELLEVVLRDEEPLRPHRFPRHHGFCTTGGVTGGAAAGAPGG